MNTIYEENDGFFNGWENCHQVAMKMLKLRHGQYDHFTSMQRFESFATIVINLYL